MSLKVVFFLLLWFIPFATFSQKGDLKVFVQDSSAVRHRMLASYISTTKIRLINEQDTTKILEATYNRKGYFLFKNVPVGKYKVLFRKAGWYGKLNGVEITSSSNQELILPISNWANRHGCYKCKSKDLIPIIYGYSISEEEKELQKQGKLIWLGCVAMENWYCKGCKNKIY